MLDPLVGCWLAIGGSLVLTGVIYWTELKKYGGIRLASPLAAAVVLYAIINPAMYLIDPSLARQYAGLIGQFRFPDELLPGLLCGFIFLVAVAFATALVPRRLLKVRGTIEPLTKSKIQRLLVIILFLGFVGIVFFLVRNQIAFGSVFGSFRAEYKGLSARPQVPVFSAFSDILGMSMGILCVMILWQIKAKTWPRWAVAIPILVGSAYAVADGNRVLLGTVMFFYLGWYSFGLKIRPRHILAILGLLTAFTLVANARYAKETSSFSERLEAIVNPEYFRPFWSGDPVGPNAVLTLEALRISETGAYSVGWDYLNALKGSVPSFISGGRWVAPSVIFASRYQEEILRQQYIPGSGYAYSAIAEGFVNFGYFGVFAAGLFLGLISWKLSTLRHLAVPGVCLVVFAYCFNFTIINVLRNSLTVFLSPMLLAHILIAIYITHLFGSAPRKKRPVGAAAENGQLYRPGQLALTRQKVVTNPPQEPS
jgi:oligosaccharide repeat unit polymerase